MNALSSSVSGLTTAINELGADMVFSDQNAVLAKYK